MDKLIKKYSDKLVHQRLWTAGDPLVGGLDAEISWNKDSVEIKILNDVIDNLNINSIIFSKPAEPYFSIINYLSKNSEIIRPEDSETRTFLHDIPITKKLSSKKLIQNLKSRKSVIIPDRGIVTYGIVSPEQAFVTYSSVCFASYVKFFTDYYYDKKLNKKITSEQQRIIEEEIKSYSNFIESIDEIPKMQGPFEKSEAIISAICEAGKLTVKSKMVDSFFGNISYKMGKTIYISQTSSSLDELEGYIDPCPIDGTASTAITASSEFSAHKSVYGLTDYNAILHGHPKFSVIYSMLCDDMDCDNRDVCYKKCNKKRQIKDVPIIPGEVGTGPTGISKTLPPALKGRGAIVWGHGLFTTGKNDFIDAFNNLIDIEKECFQQYCEKIK